jgi:hypothetical protein
VPAAFVDQATSILSGAAKLKCHFFEKNNRPGLKGLSLKGALRGLDSKFGGVE